LSSQGRAVWLREFSRGLFYFEEHDVAKGKKEEKAPKSCQECEHWTEVRNKLRVGGVLETVIKNMETKLKAEEFKPSLADFLKLMQMEREIGEEEPKEIRVTWVEPVTPSTET
jgi:pyridoxine/pyridoxamine 5'-phosphate oxidase